MHLPFGSGKPPGVPANAIRPQRLLRLETLLKNGSAWTAKELAELFGVALRTIRRDLRLLRQCDVPVIFDPIREGYRIQRREASNGLEIEVAELVALILAVKYIGGLPEGFVEPCDSAINKLLQAVSPAVRQQALAILELYPQAESPSGDGQIEEAHPHTLELPQRHLG